MSEQPPTTSDHPLTLEQWRAAMEWFDAHPHHVLRLMASKNGLDSPRASYPPSGSDKSHPELWKAPHWRWLAEDAGPGNWYRFDNPGEWTCGVRVRDCRVAAAGPSLQNIVGWEFGDALELARESGWQVEACKWVTRRTKRMTSSPR